MSKLGAVSACPTCLCIEASCASCNTPRACCNLAACCCDSVHLDWRRARFATGIRVEYLSSAWMSIEVLVSVWSGLAAGSLALLAFGGDSVIELLSGLVVLGHLQRGSADESGEASERAEKVTAALLFSLIPMIGLGAAYSFFSGLRPEGSPLGIAMAAGAVVVMPYLYFQKKRIGGETASVPLTLDAVESVTCFFMSVALLVGLLAEYFLGLWWVDYLATGVILAFVAREALESYHVIRGEEG